jgi:uncharacterized damage-inducible protein DinB
VNHEATKSTKDTKKTKSMLASVAMNEKTLRDQLVKLLDWEEAHVPFDRAVTGIPASKRGVVPERWEYSAWQLVEHIRIAQADILEFSVSSRYTAKKWPDDYWPKSPAPRDASAWTRSLAAIRADRKAMQQLARDPRLDLTAEIPHGTGQTYLREILLVAAHNSYHIGQIVALRRQLGIWNS